MAYFLGIDGGGTRTTAWLADDRHVLARAESGPSNPLKVGFEDSARQLLLASASAARAARLGAVLRETGGRLVFESVCIGLAGVDRPLVYNRLFKWLKKAIPARSHLLTSDAAIALEAALHGALGVVVISGTGSISFARDEEGVVHRSGGWGAAFDDLGSGYDLGRRAIIAALQEYDGRGAPTLLHRMIVRALGLKDITFVVLKELTARDIAALFPLVLKAANRGDRVAESLCDEAGCDLAELALALLRKLKWLDRPVPIVCSGGVFKSSERIRRSFALHLNHEARHAEIHLLRRPAIEGAISLARALREIKPR
jgi:N-acetylglucosamine kinase-like BadF-type ATPase